MAIDWLLEFIGHPPPTREQILEEAADFLMEAGKIEEINGTIFLNLIGPASPGVTVVDGNVKKFPPMKGRDIRWIEVDNDGRWVSVTTRQMDEFTNVIAQGFIDLIGRKFQADVWDPNPTDPEEATKFPPKFGDVSKVNPRHNQLARQFERNWNHQTPEVLEDESEVENE